MISDEQSARIAPSMTLSRATARLRRGFARSVALNLLSRNVKLGSLTVVEPNKNKLRFGSGTPDATIVLRDESVWIAMLYGSNGLARAYATGLWDSPDLVALSKLAATNLARLDRPRRILNDLLGPLNFLQWSGDETADERAFLHGYELGSGLYERILGPDLDRSCAYFADPEMSLPEAARAKNELICDELEIGPTDRVLEIGDSWSAFARYAAETRGCQVLSVTTNAERAAHARTLVDKAGLSDRVTIVESAPENIEGQFDKLVSIEFIEAVSWRKVHAFLKTCSRLLTDDGAMLLQVVTVDDRAQAVERLAGRFLADQIFYGHAPTSLQTLTLAMATNTDMQIASVRDLTSHYVKTLRYRRVRFMAQSPELTASGYDSRFQRLWTLFLAYGEGAFAQRRMNDLQLLLVKPRHRSSMPQRRSHSA